MDFYKLLLLSINAIESTIVRERNFKTADEAEAFANTYDDCVLRVLLHIKDNSVVLEG